MARASQSPRNKPGTKVQVSDAVRWYVWDGGFLALGRARGVVPPHSHHAIQVVLALDGEIAVQGKNGDWRTGRGVIIAPDIPHSYDSQGALGAMLFVDPESTREDRCARHCGSQSPGFRARALRHARKS